jgi:hypothetical protein
MDAPCLGERLGRGWYREEEWLRRSSVTRSKSAGDNRGRSRGRQTRHVRWAEPLQEQIEPRKRSKSRHRRRDRSVDKPPLPPRPPEIVRYRYIGKKQAALDVIPCKDTDDDDDWHIRCDLREPVPPQYMLLQQLYYFHQTAKKPDRPVRQTYKFSTRTPLSCTRPKNWTTNYKRTVTYDP